MKEEQRRETGSTISPSFSLGNRGCLPSLLLRSNQNDGFHSKRHYMFLLKGERESRQTSSALPCYAGIPQTHKKRKGHREDDTVRDVL